MIRFIYLNDLIINPAQIAYLEINQDEPDTLFIYLACGDCILLDQPEAKRFLLNYCDVQALGEGYSRIINGESQVEQMKKRLFRLLEGK